MKKPKKQPMSQGDQKMKEYHESLQEEGLRKMQEANPLMERSTFPDSFATAGVASRELSSWNETLPIINKNCIKRMCP